MLQFLYALPSALPLLCETNPLMNDPTGVYLAHIAALLPDEALTQVERAGGHFHPVWIINRRWVFRFPRYREGVQDLGGLRDQDAAAYQRGMSPYQNESTQEEQ